ncbi:hypothetical protein Halxa_1114 [Halopiger xanaduensis SH-6]|uniref:Uncharacterized protein n=1 Tax=Halopiger xanaduensis (strain DSM 18323 / JCM 14033 / SH-6) TaxID=797210 RepID=F8D9X1_HALXS|nr:hypothetical protein Halxa_1114 [Halopiger xanaduensis SH-6]
MRIGGPTRQRSDFRTCSSLTVTVLFTYHLVRLQNKL